MGGGDEPGSRALDLCGLGARRLELGRLGASRDRVRVRRRAVALERFGDGGARRGMAGVPGDLGGVAGGGRRGPRARRRVCPRGHPGTGATPRARAGGGPQSIARLRTIDCRSGPERRRTRLPRISYYPVERIEDPELRAILDHAARHGTPRPESQAVRAHAPTTLRDFWWQWERTFRNGVCDHAIKELCRVYVSKTVECGFCGAQRSTRARDELEERDYDDLLDFEHSERYDERQRAALGWAKAIAWDPQTADDELWERLHRHFTEPELVELGYCMAIVHGQLHWLRALGVRPAHEDVLAL